MSNYPKVEEGIFDTVKNNTEQFLEIVGQYFPEAIKDGEVDFTALKEEMGEFQEVKGEHYDFTWAGKQAAKKEAQADIYGRTLKFKPQDSVNADTTENIYIEGDNLEALKLLKKNYYGKIKMIYIDPPYNRGSDLIYRDDFTMTEDELAEFSGNQINGERLQKNSKDSAKYHTKWLNMMYPRLKLARDLLDEDGIIFISINDSEMNNLKNLCDSIFNEKNFIACLIWDKNHSAQSGIYKAYHEYVLVYAKNIINIDTPQALNEDLFEAGAMKKASGRHSSQPFTFPKGTRFDAEDGVEFTGTWGGVEKVTLVNGRMIAKDHKLTEDVTLEAAYTQISQMKEFFYGDKENLVDSRGQKIVEFYLTSTGKVKVVKKRGVETPQTTCHFGAQGPASTELANLFNTPEPPFDAPKPIQMLEDFIGRFTNENDIICDFFSGSATSAHAVMKVNAETNIQRHFILVQFPEDLDVSLLSANKDNKRTLETAIQYLDNVKKPHFITEIGKERIRRAAKKIHEDNPDAVFDDGFKVFEVADTNIRWNKINDQDIFDMDYSKGEKDNIDFMPGVNDIDIVYEIMLKQYGIPLSTPIEKLSDISDRTYIFADAVVVCLDADITDKLIEKLAAIEPIPAKYILRDSAFDDDIEFKDVSYRRLSALISNHQTDEEKKSKYNNFTVEFI